MKQTKEQILQSHQWLDFIAKNKLSTKQQEQFLLYLELLIEWNEKFNITRITDPYLIIADHFQDSLEICHQFAVETKKGVCDIGSGGGFPGIPISICNPDIPTVLIEVNTKKIKFLEMLIGSLDLKNITIYSQDWKTFLRDSSFAAGHPLDLFLARASLQPEELIRVLKPSSIYKNALLVYWASEQWQPSTQVLPYIHKKTDYMVGEKTRQLIFMKEQL